MKLGWKGYLEKLFKVYQQFYFCWKLTFNICLQEISCVMGSAEIRFEKSWLSPNKNPVPNKCKMSDTEEASNRSFQENCKKSQVFFILNANKKHKWKFLAYRKTSLIPHRAKLILSAPKVLISIFPVVFFDFLWLKMLVPEFSLTYKELRMELRKDVFL